MLPKVIVKYPKGPHPSITYTHEGCALFGALYRRGISYRKALDIVESLMGVHRRNVERYRNNHPVQALDEESEDNLARIAIINYRLQEKASTLGIELPADLL